MRQLLLYLIVLALPAATASAELTVIGETDGKDIVTVRVGEAEQSKQALPIFTGISGKTAGAKGLSLLKVVIPPGGAAEPHVHKGFESAVYLLQGREVQTDIRSIAVLPFDNARNDPDVDYLSDGIAETLINRLSQLGELQVMARSTAFRYRDQDVDPQQAGRELGVGAVVTGRVVQQESRVNVQAELVEVLDAEGIKPADRHIAIGTMIETPRAALTAGEFAEHVKAGKMRALAVSSPSKTDGIASLKEQGIDVELGNWRGIFGAPGLTPAQRDALVKLVKDATETPAWKQTLEKLGWTPVFLGGEDYKKFIDEDTKRIAGIIDSLGIKK